MARVAPSTIWREQPGVAMRGRVVWLLKSSGRYSFTTDVTAANASFITDSGDSRFKTQDSVEPGSVVGVFGSARRIKIINAPTV